MRPRSSEGKTSARSSSARSRRASVDGARHRGRQDFRFATAERFPEVDELVVAWPDEYLRGTARDWWTAIVVLTHDPKFDVPALVEALRTDAVCIGAMGSRRTTEERAARLRAAGVTDEELARLHAPIGLRIGGRSPEEVAVAIAAELVQATRGRARGVRKESLAA